MIGGLPVGKPISDHALYARTASRLRPLPLLLSSVPMNFDNATSLSLSAAISLLISPVQAALEATTSDSERFSIVGQCVDSESGAPLSGCAVRLTGHMSTGYPIGWGLPGWVDPQPFVTTESGEFRFSIAAPTAVEAYAGAPCRFHVSITHPDRSAWFASCEFPALVSLGRVDFGDVPLELGTKPNVRIVDTDGVPLRYAQVEARAIRHSLDVDPVTEPHCALDEGGVEVYALDSQSAITNDAGLVQWRGGLRPGAWRLSIPGLLADSVTFRAPSPGDPAPVTDVVVQRAEGTDAISGLVVDAGGAPAVGTIVEIAEDAFEGRPFAVAPDGSFRLIRGVEDPLEPVLIRFQRNYRWDDPMEIGRVAWGTENLKVVVPLAMDLAVSVVAATGEPVRTYGIHAVPKEGRPGLEAVRLGVRSTDGKTTLGLREGEWAILVVPSDGRLAPSGWIDISSDSFASGLSVSLAQNIGGKVVVVSEAGEPVVGARVRLRTGFLPHTLDAPMAVGHGVGELTTLGGALVVGEEEWSDAGGGVLFSMATTDDSGTAQLFGPSNPGDVEMDIICPDGESLVGHSVRWDGRVISVLLPSESRPKTHEEKR